MCPEPCWLGSFAPLAFDCLLKIVAAPLSRLLHHIGVSRGVWPVVVQMSALVVHPFLFATLWMRKIFHVKGDAVFSVRGLILYTAAVVLDIQTDCGEKRTQY